MAPNAYNILSQLPPDPREAKLVLDLVRELVDTTAAVAARRRRRAKAA